MSVSTDSHLFIGQTFSSPEEVIDFIKNNAQLTQEQLNELANDDLDEFLDNQSGWPVWNCLDCYSGDYFYLGYKFNVNNLISDPEAFMAKINKHKDQWQKLFNTLPQAHNEVSYS